jgi:hypothetical protein
MLLIESYEQVAALDYRSWARTWQGFTNQQSLELNVEGLKKSSI